MAEQWIKMSHPNLPDNDPVDVTFTAFINLHEKKGWKAVQPDVTEIETIPEAHARVFGKAVDPSTPKKKKSSAK